MAAGERKKKGRAVAVEAETVVRSQNMTNAKVAGMEEVGGREKMRGKNQLPNLISLVDGK